MKTNFLSEKQGRRLGMTLILSFLGFVLFTAMVGTNLDDFFMPGSQPGQSGNLEHPQKCDNCHGGYDLAVEPAFNWRGSMMSQAARDPLFYACLAIANQDAPESGDLCIRCHSPAGWLEGRSVPTDGSALNNNDMEGVQCDFCHKLVKPSLNGVNPYPNDQEYTNNTFPDDLAYLSTLGDNIPPQDGNGMYVADEANAKRGPFVDANAKHQMEYSPFHKDAAICGTCHDVSNPAFENDGNGGYIFGPTGTQAASFNNLDMFPVERTYSEWTVSDYNSAEGIPSASFGGNKANVSTCQDCHMQDVSGYGANKKGTPYRDDLPLHDMTGGNTFIPGLVAQLYPDDVDHAALQAGVDRATYMLQHAATMEVTYAENGNGGYEVNVKVINETGHKLPSGYPEGRRIWINLVAYDAAGNNIYESGIYDPSTGKLNAQGDVPKIYEIKPGISAEVAEATGLTAGPSFHFAINSEIYFDNRIPPRGATLTELESIQSPVVGYDGYTDEVGQHWDNTLYTVDGSAALVVATLYYQTLSGEYVEFLRDENTTNTAGDDLYALWETNGKSAPVVMEQVEISLIPAAPPVADFSALANYFEVEFTDQSTNNPTTWSWDFGDGGTSSDQNPIYVYASAGIYNVALTVSNAEGSDTHMEPITIEEPMVTTMYVDAITVSRISLNGNRQAGICDITILDDIGSPVSGATVFADYWGPNSGSESAVTNASGEASFETKATKNATDEWCFEVIDVIKTDYLYMAGVLTQACESTAKSMIGSEKQEIIEMLSTYPNPFDDQTTISFKLMDDTKMGIFIYSNRGELLDVIEQAFYPKGEYKYSWDATAHPSGIYLVRIIAGEQNYSFKLVKR
jgi:PKD repeat protein